MKISDKELDELFHSKLNNLAAEPDAGLWENISAGINQKPKKKSFVPALRIAAGIIVILSAGLLLLRKNDETIQKPLPQKVVKTESKPAQTSKPENQLSDEKKDMLLLPAKNREMKQVRSAKLLNKKAKVKLLENPNIETRISAPVLAANTDQEDKNNQIDHQPAIAKIAIVPDAATSLKIRSEENQQLLSTVKPQLLADKRSRPEVVSKRKGIRNMGDLVNLVMAKVDKRQDKLIEFTATDDGDESNVTGINLGIISIKKEK